ncbi:glucokinase [Bradyrhizobium sp. dw_78]|uniref:glucokinase n=1 Tax=Bradyrhizobium sp. dw_78 TaxID=2719793 RepID=UPI001BD5D0CB
MNGLRLIADIGGTNARFALAQNGRYSRLSTVEDGRYDTLHDAIVDYLAVLPAEERSGLSAAIAIAAPVSGDQITMTNKTWSFSVEELKRSLNLASLKVVNDFAATAQAIPHLAESERYVVGMPTSGTGNIGVVGPGTGLGMSSLIPHGADWVLVAGEGGHTTLAASTEEEFAIVRILRKRWTHVSAERVLSGAGLVNLYEALCAIQGIEALMLTPADVTRHALHGSDNNCIKAFDYFCGFLGSVAGDLALTIGAFGGVYIAGGILLRFKEAFAASSFRQRFESKGRFSTMLEQIPTYLILDDSPALTGLANLPLDI